MWLYYVVSGVDGRVRHGWGGSGWSQAASGQNATQRIDCGCGHYVVHQRFCMYHCTLYVASLGADDCQVLSHVEESVCCCLDCFVPILFDLIRGNGRKSCNCGKTTGSVIALLSRP